MADAGLILVLLGPHASGKSTIGKLLSERHGWRCDVRPLLFARQHDAPLTFARSRPARWRAPPQEELGEALRRRGAHAAVDCRAQQDGFDAAVALAEAARDDAAAAQRVVETWHPGNLGWAEMRASPAALATLRAGAAAAVGRVAAARPASLLLVQPLSAGVKAIALRRAAGAAARVPARASGGAGGAAGAGAAGACADAADEAALLAHTARVAQAAAQHAAALGLRTLPPVATDGGGDAGAAADAVFANVLAAAHPAPRAVPNLYTSLADAAALLRAAAALDMRLRAPEPAAFLRSVAALEAATQAGALPLARGRAVVIEGLDGTGKSTLAAALAAALNAHAARTPPASLAALRPLFDACCAPVARAFYMCCNYIAAAELAQLAADGRPTVVSMPRCAFVPALDASCTAAERVSPCSRHRWTAFTTPLLHTRWARRARAMQRWRRCRRLRLPGRPTCRRPRWCCCCAWRTLRACGACAREGLPVGGPQRRRSRRMAAWRAASTTRTRAWCRRPAAAWSRWTRMRARKRCAPQLSPPARRRGCDG